MKAGSIARASASELEAVIVEALRTAYPDDTELDARALIEARVARVVVRAGSILVQPSADEAIEIAWSPPAPSGRREILVANGVTHQDGGIKAEARTVLLRSIALGRRWLDEVLGGATVDEIAARERCTQRHVMNTIPLAFLAPEIVRAVIEARLPRGISARAIGEPDLACRASGARSAW